MPGTPPPADRGASAGPHQRVALVTGAGSGIGRALAAELTARGCRVIATSRRAATLENLDCWRRDELDVADPAQAERVVRRHEPIDVLVNSAGVGLRGPVERMPEAEIRRAFDVNYFGALRLMQLVLPGMRARGGGTIVNISSIAGFQARPLNGFYASTKHALEATSEALWHEVGAIGVRVLVVEPGAVASGFDASRTTLGEDVEPYRSLGERWDAVIRSRATRALTAEAVAAMVADELAHPTVSLRLVLGDDALEIARRRRTMSEAEFAEDVRRSLELGHDAL